MGEWRRGPSPPVEQSFPSSPGGEVDVRIVSVFPQPAVDVVLQALQITMGQLYVHYVGFSAVCWCWSFFSSSSP